MNERILNLAERAGIAIWGDAVYMYRPGDTLDSTVITKFAEMLIKECITIVDEQKECLHEEQKYWHDRDYGYEMAVNDASKGIKQFFGVEE